MIQIIKGVYGRVVNGAVEAMTKHSPPFSLPAAREAELIAAGVAVKVEDPAEESPFASMKMADLREVAAAHGADVSGIRTKRELIAALEAAGATVPDDEAEE